MKQLRRVIGNTRIEFAAQDRWEPPRKIEPHFHPRLLGKWPLLAFASCTVLALTSCTPAPRDPPRSEPPPVILPAAVVELSPDEAERLLADSPGLAILDVRSDGEAHTEGKIAGAQMYDYLHGEDAFQALEKLDHTRPYLIYCAIGGRAKLTAVRMHEMGFAKLSLLKGGLNAWIAAGKPVQK